MAYSGGTPAPAAHPAPINIGSERSQPVTKAAASRVQRYYNKGTGRMEALRGGHFPGQRPVQRAAQRPGRPVQRPGQAPVQAGAKSLLQMSPAEVEAHARSIVASEMNAERLPFQQRLTGLAGEAYGQQKAHEQTYEKLDTGLAAQQTHAGESAKTFQNVAAEAVKRAEGQKPGGEQAGEHAAGGEALAKQEAAAKTLLTAIAMGAQAGTNARQQGESGFLTNMRANAQQEGAAGSQQIAGEYGKRKQEVSQKEGDLLASKPGRVGKLSQALLGEREKLGIAAQGLGIKTAEAERHGAEARSNIAHRTRADALAERKNEADEAYKRAGQGAKERKDSLDIRKKEVEIKKTLEGGTPGGKPLTKEQVNTYSAEMSRAFQFFQRARSEGASPEEIRQELEQGQGRRSYQVKGKSGKTETKHYTEKFSAVKNPTFIQAAIDIMQKEYIGAQTKQQLREMGLPDSGWSEKFLPKKAPSTMHKGGHA